MVNRATYDRIASRYAENHQLHESSGDSMFSKLEETFLSKVPYSGMIADVGCGPGFHAARFVARGFRTVGIDLSAGMLDVASQRLSGRLVQADMRDLPLSSDRIDGIWCLASLLHVPEVDTILVFREFKRVLRSSGVLALVTAVGESARLEAVPYVPGEQRWFVYRDPSILKGQLLAAGFSIILEDQIHDNRVWSMFLLQAK